MPTELIFNASRKKAFKLLLISIAFVAIGVWLMDQKPWLGWLCTGFFGLGIPVSLLMMRRGHVYLKLDAQGFDMVSMSRHYPVKWTEVDAFQMGRMSGNKMIAIVFNGEYTRQRAGRAVAQAMAGIEAGIPDHYEAPLEEVCRALNEWLARHGGPAGR